MNIERIKQLAGMTSSSYNKTRLSESMHSPAVADVSHLSKQLSTGEITYDQFRDKLDSLENPTYDDADADYSEPADDAGLGVDDTYGLGDTADSFSDPFSMGEPVDNELDDPFSAGAPVDEYGFDENAYDEFSPSGADGPVTAYVGPAGAMHGDNPMQKRMQVAEVHKSLVYGYRKFINETRAASTRK